MKFRMHQVVRTLVEMPVYPEEGPLALEGTLGTIVDLYPANEGEMGLYEVEFDGGYVTTMREEYLEAVDDGD